MPRQSTRPSTTSAPTHELHRGSAESEDSGEGQQPTSGQCIDRIRGRLETAGRVTPDYHGRLGKLQQTGGPHWGPRRRTHTAGGHWSGSVVSHHYGPPPDSLRGNHVDNRHQAAGSGSEQGVVRTITGIQCYRKRGGASTRCRRENLTGNTMFCVPLQRSGPLTGDRDNVPRNTEQRWPTWPHTYGTGHGRYMRVAHST